MSPPRAVLTFHAEKRARQRLGIPKAATIRDAERAREHGLTHDEATGKLKGYIEYIYTSYGGSADSITIYNGHVYIFSREVLVTVYPIDPEYRRPAQYQQKRKKERDRDGNRIQTAGPGTGDNHNDHQG